MLARLLQLSGHVALVASLTLPAQADFLAGKLAFQNGDYETALRELRPAAEDGHAEAQLYLGMMYSRGRGVQRDDTEAVKWILRSAEQGNVSAQTMLGMRYVSGRGVPQNDDEAVKWFRAATRRGHPPAQHNLGIMYEQGRGVP
ncbi:MAG: sel1 repeat family protein [Acidimicrobiia bacterium]|nr:sel1 repeat family protein [Acidimicrobiia bacterium]